MAAVERELKYEALAGFAPPVVGFGTWAPARRHELRAEYFDTPAFDLNRARVTLRRRTGGDDAGWHLKRPAGEFRSELQLGLEASALLVPAAFRAELGTLVAGRPLVPIAVLETVRFESDLIGPTGEVRAHLASDTVTAHVRGTIATWHEVEAELAQGEPLATLDDLDAALLAAGCKRAAHGSKVGKALGQVSEPAPLGVGSPAGDLVLAQAAKQVAALQRYADGVRTDAPDAVHKSRVAARRLRSLLRRFSVLLDAEYTGHLIAELRWYGEVAGAPRDEEVLKEHLLALLDDIDPDAFDTQAGRHLIADLDARHAQAHADLVRAMDSQRYADLHRALAGLLVDRPLRDIAWLPAEFVLHDLVEATVERVGRKLTAAGRDPGRLERWHEVRKAAKAARYCCEALEDVYPGAEEAAERWEAATEALGDAQDTVVAHRVLGELALAASGRGESTAVHAELQEAQLDKRSGALASGIVAAETALADDLGWLR